MMPQVKKQEAIRLKEQYEALPAGKQRIRPAGFWKMRRRWAEQNMKKILRQADDDAAKKLEQADRMIGLEREKDVKRASGA